MRPQRLRSQHLLEHQVLDEVRGALARVRIVCGADAVSHGDLNLGGTWIFDEDHAQSVAQVESRDLETDTRSPVGCRWRWRPDE
jgi:hypothetical protein